MGEKDRSKMENRVLDQAEEFRATLGGFFPPEFRQHMLSARKEFLLAVRSLIDARIESLERSQERASKRAKKIPVE